MSKQSAKLTQMPLGRNRKNFHELFQILQKTDESNQIEVKSAANGLGRSFLEAVSAFSNEPYLEGGYIILGVTRNESSSEPRYLVTGVKNPDDLQRQIASQCLELLSIPIRPYIQVAAYGEKTVIVVHIEEAQPLQKPVFIKSLDWMKGAYRRIGSSNQTCIIDDIKYFLQLQTGLRHEEMHEVRASFEDFDPNALALYRYAREKIKADATELKYNNLELLKAVQAITTVHGATAPTIGGLLLFGSKQILRRLFPLRSQIDYITTHEKDLSKGYTSIEFTESLITGIPKIVETVMHDVPLVFSLAEDGVTRKETPLIPKAVIREALVNAVTNRDYQQGGSLMIIKYPHKLEIRNFGYSLKSTDPLLPAGSMARNSTISKVLQDIDYAEAKGSGISKMRKAMSSENLIVPLIKSSRKDNYFMLTLLNHQFNEEDKNWLAPFGLSEEEGKNLIVVREMGEVTNAIYRSINLVDCITAGSQLQELRMKGLIEQKGIGCITYSIPIDKLRPSDMAKHGLYTASTLVKDPLIILLDELPSELRNQVLQIGKKVNSNEIRTLITTLCSLRPYKPSELGRLLRRSTRNISERYIAPLVESGDLRMLYPGNPAHPQQAYSSRMPGTSLGQKPPRNEAE